MTVTTIDLPAMYGDHHVSEVRRILLDLEGVEEVYASSGFRAAEVTYNSKKLKKAEIVAKLEEAGYIGPSQKKLTYRPMRPMERAHTSDTQKLMPKPIMWSVLDKG